MPSCMFLRLCRKAHRFVQEGAESRGRFAFRPRGHRAKPADVLVGEAVLDRPFDQQRHVTRRWHQRRFAAMRGEGDGGHRLAGIGQRTGFDLEPIVVADAHTLGELDVLEIGGAELVQHAEGLSPRIGEEVGERFADRRERRLVEYDAPSHDASGDGSAGLDAAPPAKGRGLHVGAVGEVPEGGPRAPPALSFTLAIRKDQGSGERRRTCRTSPPACITSDRTIFHCGNYERETTAEWWWRPWAASGTCRVPP